MIPKMIVIAGPPGSGKSSIFPVSGFGVAYFNADDRAAKQNGGSYVGIAAIAVANAWLYLPSKALKKNQQIN